MPEWPALAVQSKHRMGTFQLDVSFTVERWPALLFGPSGAGKSTLLRIIAGLLLGRGY
jgi:molybdate transport system ATP-binding protein